MLPDKYKMLVALNPLTGIIEAFRSTVIPNKQIDLWLLLFSITVSILLFIIGLIYFRKTEKVFADIV